jgi:hypothetical protein
MHYPDKGCIAVKDDERKENIAFLEDFRGLVDDYLFLGYAPPSYDEEGLDRVAAALDNQAYRELRRRISGLKVRANRILELCGVVSRVEVIPPASVGGYAATYNLLDLITDNRSIAGIDKHTFLDAFDTAIGVLSDKTVVLGPEHRSNTTHDMEQGRVFIAMPMDPDDHSIPDVHNAIKEIAESCGLFAERVDDPVYTERITDKVIEMIEKSEFMVVDLTNSKPNVYFEAGYAHSMGKLPIYIAREGTEVEFDVKDYPVLFFKNTKELRRKLKEKFTGLLLLRPS